MSDQTNNVMNHKDDPIMKSLWISAENGYPDAQYKLGQCFLCGTGVKNKDAAMAVSLFRKSAEQGYAKAQCALGECLLEGTGTSQNEAEGMDWIRKSAAQGYAKAIDLLQVREKK